MSGSQSHQQNNKYDDHDDETANHATTDILIASSLLMRDKHYNPPLIKEDGVAVVILGVGGKCLLFLLVDGHATARLMAGSAFFH